MPQRASRSADRFWSRVPVAELTAGLVVGLLCVALTIALAVLVYSGGLQPFLIEGIGLALLSAVLIGAVVALTSSLPGMVASVQDAPAAILAVAAAAAVAGAPATAAPRDLFVTVVVATGLVTALTALLLLTLGASRLGRLVRYLPYPVVGGFLAGTGWLLLTGGIGVMAGVQPSGSYLADLFGAGVWWTWTPGLALAVVLVLVTRRSDHALVWPGTLLSAVALFFLVLVASGGSLAQWRSAGLLLGPFPEADLLRPLDYRELGRVRWGIVGSYAPTAVAVAVLSTMSVLFNATGLELETERKIDLDRELRAAGLGNLLAGCVGGMVGYQMLGFTALNHRVGTGSRAAALVAVGVVAAALVFGASLLAFVPTFVVGGLLAFLGLTFLLQWLWGAAFELSKLEYAIVLLILVVIAAVGFLEGIGVGVAAALLLFVVSYSRADVVKHALSGREYRSRVSRDDADTRILDEQGENLYILELQGFIFFGTANGLLERIEARFERVPSARFVVLDFRRVTGLDATALVGFEKLVRLAERRGVTLVLSDLAAGLARQLEGGAIAPGAGRPLRAFATLDRALEWCEARLLAESDPGSHVEREPLRFVRWLEQRIGDPRRASELAACFEEIEVASGAPLIRQGNPAEALYFVERGRVTARLERAEGPPIRLESMRGGTVVGELGFYTGDVRTASVVADEPTTAFRLTRDALERVERRDPALAAMLHELVVRLLAKRTAHLVRAVAALQR